jgi:pyruvate/2-oxoglutarate dehydrogenase complex dihydrolipoamide dehydrogenase (E3) component
MTEAEVRASGRPALMAIMPMERVSRAFEKGETQGFMKILVDQETQLILGASLLGVGGDEVNSYHSRPHVCQGAVYRHAKSDAHPSDGF